MALARARSTAPLPNLGGSLVLRRLVLELFLFLARGDAHHLHGVADHVGGALLALRSFRHHSAASSKLSRSVEVWHFPQAARSGLRQISAPSFPHGERRAE